MSSAGFFYTDENGNLEQVAIERWVWGALYQDGTELHQFDDNHVFHRIGEVDQKRLKMFSLYKPLGDDRDRIDIPFQPGMRLVYKYRNIKPYYKENFERVYMAGYKYEGRHNFFFILPDDRIIVSPVDNIDLSQFNV